MTNRDLDTIIEQPLSFKIKGLVLLFFFVFGCTVFFLRQSLTASNYESIRLKFVEPLISIKVNKLNDSISSGIIQKPFQSDNSKKVDLVFDKLIKISDSSDYNTNSILIHYFHPDSLPVFKCEVQEGIYSDIKRNKFQKVVIETDQGPRRMARVKLEKSIRKSSDFYVLYFKAVDFKFSNLKSGYIECYNVYFEFPNNKP